MPAKERYIYLYVIGLALFLLALGFFAPHAQAAVVVQQTDLDEIQFGEAAGGAGLNIVQDLGGGYSGTIESITLWASKTSSGGFGTTIQVYECDTPLTISDGSDCSTYNSESVGLPNPTATAVTFPFTTPIDLVDTSYYGIQTNFAVNFGNTVSAHGTSENSFDGGDVIYDLSWAPSGLSSQTLTDMYFIVEGTGGTPTPSNEGVTRVYGITEPELYSIVASTTPFSVEVLAFANASSTQPNAYKITYRNDVTYEYHEQSGYLVDDASWVPADGPDITISTTTQLTSSGTWSMSAVLGIGYTNGVEGGPGLINEFYTVGAYYSGHRFSVDVETNVSTVVSGQGYVLYPEESCDLNLNPFASSTFNGVDCMGYLFQPPVDSFNKYSTLTLEQKFPFAYAYQFPAIKDALYDNQNYDDQAITVEILGGELTFLSRSMVEDVPFSALIRELLSAVMWFLLAYALYRMVLRSHDNHTV